MQFKENVLLRDHTTFKIGGPAKYFVSVKTEKDLISALKKSREMKLRTIFIGGGSNILFSDNGFDGLVIKMNIKGAKARGSVIVAKAGTELNNLVFLSKSRCLTGLEWAAGIPGSIGGAVFGNAGAFWKSMQDIVKGAEVLDIKKIKRKRISNFLFSNKDSIFKKKRDFIILSVKLKMKKGKKQDIKNKIEEYIKYRKETHPLKYPSAGCVFKNHIPEPKNKGLFKRFPELSEFNKKGRIPSAYLIEKAGLKGKRIGDAQISSLHSNFIVNLGKAKSEDVLLLIKLAKKNVFNKFGIILEEEIQCIK